MLDAAAVAAAAVSVADWRAPGIGGVRLQQPRRHARQQPVAEDRGLATEGDTWLNHQQPIAIMPRNAEAIEALIQKHGVQVRRFPEAVLRELARRSDQVLRERAARDPLSQEVFDSMMPFRRKLTAWAGVSLARAIPGVTEAGESGLTYGETGGPRLETRRWAPKLRLLETIVRGGESPGGKEVTVDRSIAAFLLAACALPAQDSARNCSWYSIETGEAAGNDKHAAYYIFVVIPAPDDRLEVDAEFPHARYFSWTVYGEDHKMVRSINDRQIQPVHGKNPFHPGVARHEPQIGSYRLTFRFRQSAAERANTLHIPGAGGGRRFVIIYRLYDVDGRYSSGHLAVSGGVPAPVPRLYDAAGKSYCPGPLRPPEQQPPTRKPPANIENPPVWRHSGSTTAQAVPWANEGVVYVSAYLSGRHGPLAVLRWKAPRTPVETFAGEPFPGEEEMRFWSLDISGPPRIALVDREVPQLADGSRQLVIGFNGNPKPSFVPANQWVGMEGQDVRVFLRVMLPADEYAHNLTKLPAGLVPPQHMIAVPGGVYCTPEQLKANPDIGVRWGDSK